MEFCRNIVSKDGETVEVGALLGRISENGVQPSEKKVITKIEPKKEENNVINLEVKKETPRSIVQSLRGRATNIN